MRRSLSIIKNWIYLLCFLCVLNSCTGNIKKDIPRVHTVEIKDMKFQPADLIVQKGDTVVWINKDLVAHDVTEESSKAWSSSLMPAGQSWRFVVTQSADYYCSIHVVMKGKLRVQ